MQLCSHYACFRRWLHNIALEKAAWLSPAGFGAWLRTKSTEKHKTTYCRWLIRPLEKYLIKLENISFIYTNSSSHVSLSVSKKQGRRKNIEERDTWKKIQFCIATALFRLFCLHATGTTVQTCSKIRSWNPREKETCEPTHGSARNRNVETHLQFSVPRRLYQAVVRIAPWHLLALVSACCWEKAWASQFWS